MAEPAAAIALQQLAGEPPVQLLRAVRALASSPVVSRRIAGLVALARYDAAMGATGSARRRMRAASAELLRAQLGVASLDLRAAVALHGQPALALDLDLAERLPGRRGVDALVDAAERWRAAARPMPRVRPDPDPMVAMAVAQLRRVRAEFAGAPETPRCAGT
ncbi:hypothetical protein G7085_06495 [Tessaracoccus sp. HDW20]|uniref:hypothetical protein n=1 Tax=Tessaracoccus coleopterorum TaxID=2714950 RepID=UPI0018D495E3|nr:hypothetical protein [Tessaracoccus coleopterorum]NHB84375.1 hypothetical protein [Tessaracoccus coleopterorum]